MDVEGVRRMAETSSEAIDRLNRQIWDPIRAEHQSVHRGFGMQLSDEDHAIVHDPSRPTHERASHLMDLIANGDHDPDGGLGTHWTTDANVAHHFARYDASSRQKYDWDRDGKKYGCDPDGVARARPETRVVMHAHFPEHKHIAHEVDDQDGAFRWDERNPVQHDMNGGGVDFEREVPIKRRKPVHVHAISWGLASHRSDAEAPHDRETTRYDFPQTLTHHAARTPHKRIFGPTFGLDHRLFDDEHLKPDVREWILGTINAFWQPMYGNTWHQWSRVYFAGSEASEWTSQDRVGNGDFDVLIGVDYQRCRVAVPSFAELGDEEITARLNADLTTLLWPRLIGIHIPVDGQQVGPFSATFYVNLHSWDIRAIKPYAAYNVTADGWAVKPPHLPDWSIKDFPEGAALQRECEAVAAYVRAILELPEPYRSQQGDALWRHLHADRGRAFTGQGEGWFDPGNVLEKHLDQLGLWGPLAQIHFDVLDDPSRLNAPADWSNDPRAAA